jgi:hypothetical protein
MWPERKRILIALLLRTIDLMLLEAAMELREDIRRVIDSKGEC